MCGIFGAVDRFPEAEAGIGKIVYAGLFPLQPRGQESAGISTFCNGELRTHRAMGTIDWVFRSSVANKALVGFVRNNPDQSFDNLGNALEEWIREQHDLYQNGEESAVQNPLDNLLGSAAIGHLRYSTQGESGNKNIHPILFEFQGKPGAIAHNGNLIELERLRDIIYKRDPNFSLEGNTDTELIAALFSTSSHAVFEDALPETLSLLVGAFSLTILYDGVLYATRDRSGIRPLFWGKNDRYTLVASETCSLDSLGAENIQEIPPGSVWRFDNLSSIGVPWIEESYERLCIFEGIYFSSPDSLFAGQRINAQRRAMGRMLAREHPGLNVDIVVPILDSGKWAATGYAEESGIPLCEALVRGRVGRTFIEPIKEIREALQHLKHRPIIEEIRGKRVLLIDDSIVRGTTLNRIARMLRDVGAKAVSALSSSPPIRNSCHLGMNTPYPKELIAHGRSPKEIREIIGLDYLGYLSLEGMYEAINKPRSQFCDGCITGEYPVPPEKPAFAG